MNQARLLDLQDRFINSKSTKYLLRNDQLQRADEVVGLFAKVRPGHATQSDQREKHDPFVIKGKR